MSAIAESIAVSTAPLPVAGADTPQAGRRVPDFAGVLPLGSASGLSALVTRHPQDGWVAAAPYPLGRAGRRAMRSVIRLMCPPAPAPSVEPMMERVETHILRLLRYMPRVVAWGVRAAFVLLDHAPRLLFASHRRLSGLSPEAGSLVLARLAASPFGPVLEAIKAIRGLVLSSYFDQDEVHEAMHYAPGTFMRERIALRERLKRGSAPEPGDTIAPPPARAPFVQTHMEDV